MAAEDWLPPGWEIDFYGYGGRREPSHMKMCHGHPVLRRNRKTKELFWGCSAYPAGCRWTRQHTQQDLVHEAKEERASRVKRGPLIRMLEAAFRQGWRAGRASYDHDWGPEPTVKGKWRWSQAFKWAMSIKRRTR